MDSSSPIVETKSRGKQRIVVVTTMLLLLVAVSLLLLYLLGQQRTSVARTKGPLRLEPVAVITGPGVGPIPGFSKPMGVAFAPNGDVYVADTGNDRVCVFRSNGRFVTSWGGLGIAKPLPGFKRTWKPGLLNYPTDVDVDAQGQVYVADFHNDHVSVFSADGGYVSRFPDPEAPTGKGGSGKDGRGIAVTSVAASEDRVFASDAYQVFVFAKDGTYLDQFGKPGNGDSDLDHPNGLAVDEDGNPIVADSNHVRIASFDASGTHLWSTSRTGGRESDGEALGLPRGLARLSGGRVIVADAVGQSLVVLNHGGKIAATLGKRGLGPGEFNFPADVDTTGDLVVVADKENDRVQVLRIVGGGSARVATAETRESSVVSR